MAHSSFDLNGSLFYGYSGNRFQRTDPWHSSCVGSIDSNFSVTSMSALKSQIFAKQILESLEKCSSCDFLRLLGKNQKFQWKFHPTSIFDLLSATLVTWSFYGLLPTKLRRSDRYFPIIETSIYPGNAKSPISKEIPTLAEAVSKGDVCLNSADVNSLPWDRVEKEQ